MNLPPLPPHPIARSRNRFGVPYPNYGWNESEAAAIRAYATEAIAAERERVLREVMPLVNAYAEAITQTERNIATENLRVAAAREAEARAAIERAIRNEPAGSAT